MPTVRVTRPWEFTVTRLPRVPTDVLTPRVETVILTPGITLNDFRTRNPIPETYDAARGRVADPSRATMGLS